MKTLKDYNGREIKYFNDDNAQISYFPNGNCKFILQIESHSDEYEVVNKIFILHLDRIGNEIERWDALSPSITRIAWKEEECKHDYSDGTGTGYNICKKCGDFQ